MLDVSAPTSDAQAPGFGGGRAESESDGGSETDSDDSCLPRGCKRQGPDDEEKCHFLDVCYSLLEYRSDALRDISRMQAMVAQLDPHDLALWKSDPAKLIGEILPRVEANTAFLKLLPSPDVCGVDLGPDAQKVVSEVPDGHRAASRNLSKVRSTLRQFVRDWADEGEPERAASYAPLIEALQRHLPANTRGCGPRGSIAVLCPGCGLGRLPFDLARLGYAAQGNEFSYHMLLGSHLILNRSAQSKCFRIYPFVLSTTSRRGKDDHLREIKVPNLCPSQVLPPTALLSMAAGEFVEVYKDQQAAWDAVLSCFFLDTAKNIFLYIRTIAMLIRPGGCLINIGPLLYHYADMEHEISIELSWEEVKPNLLTYFEILEEQRRDALYSTNAGSLMAVQYHCVFFVARRNAVPVSGVSNPVF